MKIKKQQYKWTNGELESKYGSAQQHASKIRNRQEGYRLISKGKNNRNLERNMEFSHDFFICVLPTSTTLLQKSLHFAQLEGMDPFQVLKQILIICRYQLFQRMKMGNFLKYFCLYTNSLFSTFTAHRNIFVCMFSLHLHESYHYKEPFRFN